MLRRILAIAAIFLGASLAWAILGSTIFARTYSAGNSLSGRVASTWGAPQEQAPPEVQYVWMESQTVTAEENGKKVTREERKERGQAVSLDSSRVEAQIHVDYRQKGLLWFSTYTVAFRGEHAFHNPSYSEQTFVFRLPLPAEQAVYDGLSVSLDGRPLSLVFGGSDVTARAVLPGGAQGVLKTTYRSQGQKSWRYHFGQKRSGETSVQQSSGISQANDFHMAIKTDFSGFDFPDNSLSPTEKRRTGNGWELLWDYQNLVSGYDIALTMPEKLQPGPLAGEISYFFLASAFFAFHLLLAYLADHISIHLAFAISSLVSILLVVSYLRLVVIWRFAAVDAGLAQLIYLVLFSYAFFFEGFTGLAVTVGAILSLFVVMQMTGRIQCKEKFASAPLAPVPARG